VTETADGQTSTQTHTVDLTYDASGNPQTMTYDGVTYYYTVNIQGDVTGIVDESGNVLVRYNYQAYGTTTFYGVPTGSDGSILRQINPLTYRGYVYDKETKLYYLQSRYYNRTTGRFINADSLVITGQGLLGNNMFAYCNNCPVNYIDHSGEDPITISVGTTALIVVGIAAIAIIVVSLIGQLAEMLQTLELSFARAKSHEYSRDTEVHHLVAQEAHNAEAAAAILRDVYPDGTENGFNKIRIKTGLHRRLHTKRYYAVVNTIVINAYFSAEDSDERMLQVTRALLVIRAFVSVLNEASPY